MDAPFSLAPAAAAVPQAPASDRRNGYLPADFDAFINHSRDMTPPPNFEPMEPGDVINAFTLAGLQYRKGWFRSAGGATNWALYALVTGQGGQLTGEGYVLYYQSAYGGSGGQGGRFAICKHTKADAPGANHSRGWHPGHCTKCGLDMTVDSGD